MSSRTAATARVRLRPIVRPRSASVAGSGGVRALMAAPDNTFAVRQLVEELASQLRAGVEKLGDLPQETGERLARELGLVTREEYDALALRLAQLEHRLKLLEWS